MSEFIVVFLLWISVLIPSSVFASLISRRSPKMAVYVMQFTIFLFSVILMEVMGGMERFNLFWRWDYVPQASLIGFGVSFIFNLFANDVDIPEFLPGGIEGIIMLLLIAPLSEEVFNRGLLEGYLIFYGHFWSAIFFSALLFALPHWVAFKGGFGKKTLMAVEAFIIGSLSGYFFILGGLFPAFTLHSSANLAGIMVNRIRKV